MQVMIGSRGDVAAHIDSLLGDMLEQEHHRNAVIDAMGDLLIDRVNDEIDAPFTVTMDWSRFIEDLWPGDQFFADVADIIDSLEADDD